MRRILVILALVLVLCACERMGGEAMQATRNTVVDLTDAPVTGQSFQSPTGSVAGVDLLVATYGETPDAAGILEVELVDLESGDMLASAAVEGSELADNAWAPVRFDGTAA